MRFSGRLTSWGTGYVPGRTHSFPHCARDIVPSSCRLLHTSPRVNLKAGGGAGEMRESHEGSSHGDPAARNTGRSTPSIRCAHLGFANLALMDFAHLLVWPAPLEAQLHGPCGLIHLHVVPTPALFVVQSCLTLCALPWRAAH